MFKTTVVSISMVFVISTLHVISISLYVTEICFYYEWKMEAILGASLISTPKQPIINYEFF